MLSQHFPVLVVREELGQLVKAGLVLLGDVLPGLLEPVDWSALKGRHHCLQTVQVVELEQFLQEERQRL